MLHNECTIECKIEIGCYGCSVVMATSQKSHFHEIYRFGIISFLL